LLVPLLATVPPDGCVRVVDRAGSSRRPPFPVHACYLLDTARGNRPSFTHAAPPEIAEPVFERFRRALEGEGVSVQRGVFGARMLVEIANDGPVTIVLEA
jgi:hypothetical protein